MREQLKALRSFTYAGKALVAGSEFKASRQDARVLRALGRAKSVVQAAYVAPAAPVAVTKSGAGAEPKAQAGRKPKAGAAQ